MWFVAMLQTRLKIDFLPIGNGSAVLEPKISFYHLRAYCFGVYFGVLSLKLHVF